MQPERVLTYPAMCLLPSKQRMGDCLPASLWCEPPNLSEGFAGQFQSNLSTPISMPISPTLLGKRTQQCTHILAAPADTTDHTCTAKGVSNDCIISPSGDISKLVNQVADTELSLLFFLNLK